MEFRQIRYFIEITRAGSFLKAAAGLGLTQPALSTQIARLEQELGAQLLDRSGRYLRLTAAGELFLERAIQLNDLWQETLEVLKTEDREMEGKFTISTGGTIAAWILPPVLQKIRQRHPGLSFRVIEGDALQTREALATGDVDLGILSGQSKESGLERKFFLTDTIVPVLGKSHPLARKDRVTLAGLRKEEFVLFHPASSIRRALEKRFRSLKPRFQPITAMELRGMESVIRSVETGIGIGFLSRFCLTKNMRELPLPDLIVERDFHFVYRQGSRAGLGRLIELIQEIATEQFKLEAK